jgi:membrane protease YdiL (CAAX protease family)
LPEDQLPDPNPLAETEIVPSSEPSPAGPPPSNGENPVWSGWAVLQLIALTMVAVFVSAVGLAYGAHRFLYPTLPFAEVATSPVISVVAQLLAYIPVFAFMVALAKRNRQVSFWREVKWNWPAHWASYLFAGVVLTFALQALAHYLPVPKELPIDKFFKTAKEAWLLSIFGVTVAPFMEEMFFRGFMYPALARRVGVVVAVVVTSLCFGLIHADQLGRAWGPVLVIFLVGLALTITRVVTQSVAAGALMHAGYNATLFLLLFLGTDGFRHLERIVR